MDLCDYLHLIMFVHLCLYKRPRFSLAQCICPLVILCKTKTLFPFFLFSSMGKRKIWRHDRKKRTNQMFLFSSRNFCSIRKLRQILEGFWESPRTEIRFVSIIKLDGRTVRLGPHNPGKMNSKDYFL